MVKKFSLKDNPIFQRLDVPKPKEVAPSAAEPLSSTEIAAGEEREIPTSEGQLSTLDNRPSEEDPQKTGFTEPTASSAETSLGGQLAGQPALASPSAPDLELKDHLDKSLFFSYYTAVGDELLPRLNPAEQVLYHRLFRLSYGFNRNYCTVSQPLLMEGTGLSRNTIRAAVQSLVTIGWIKIVGAGKHISTTYRVVLPREELAGERIRGSITDPQNRTLKNSPSQNEAQKMTFNDRGPDFKP